MALALPHRPHRPAASARPFLAFAGGMALVAVVHDGQLPWPGVVIALCAWGALTAVGSGALGCCAIAVLMSAVANGFVENRFGVLSWHGQRDALLLALMLASSATGALVGKYLSRPAHPTSTSTSEQKEQ